MFCSTHRIHTGTAYSSQLRSKRLRWFGHVSRMQDYKTPKVMMFGQVKGQGVLVSCNNSNNDNSYHNMVMGNVNIITACTSHPCTITYLLHTCHSRVCTLTQFYNPPFTIHHGPCMRKHRSQLHFDGSLPANTFLAELPFSSRHCPPDNRLCLPGSRKCLPSSRHAFLVVDTAFLCCCLC